MEIHTRTERLTAAVRKVDVFALVEKLLVIASLALVAITIGGQLGDMLGLAGWLGDAVAWSIAIVFDALWIGSLRMSELAIRQRNKLGMGVMLGLSVAAVAGSTLVLNFLGHVQVFCLVPVAAALFMGLRLFAANVLADTETARQIAQQSADDRNTRALAAADARHLRSEAVTDVVTETAGHLAEADRQIARAEILTTTQTRIDAARAAAEKKLADSDKKNGVAARAFAARRLAALESRQGVTPPASRGLSRGVTQPKGEIEGATPHPVPTGDADIDTTFVEHGVTLDEVASVAGVDAPQPGQVDLSDKQIEVVLRWLRYQMNPPRSYRSAVAEYRRKGFKGGEEKLRRIWGQIETREVDPGDLPVDVEA